MINFSLREGVQLTNWKKANVSPIFKKGNTNHAENYRPVSLLPVMSKVQERCVASRLVPHVKNILYPFQHGFQRGKSCISQLLEVFQDIGQALDCGVKTDIVYLDFAKAFDSVCPAKLVTKLKLYGIGDPLLSWFYSYLVGKEQRVVINGTCSTWTEVGSGVPQGSILGPILFLLFINYTPNVVSSARIAMFADDSKCYKIIEQESDFVQLQQDLDALLVWALRNEIYFQPAKCKNVRISRKRVSPPLFYNLNGFDLEVVESEKDLGVMIANDTSWKEHIVMIVAKANRMLGFLKRCWRGLVDSEALVSQSVVSQLILIEQVQRRATRFIVGKGGDLCYRDRLIKLKILPLNYWLE